MKKVVLSSSYPERIGFKSFKSFKNSNSNTDQNKISLTNTTHNGRKRSVFRSGNIDSLRIVINSPIWAWSKRVENIYVTQLMN